jgi:hypothetical protein
MDVAVSLPVMKGDMRFKCVGTEIRWIVEFSDGEKVEFARNDGRWRWVCGPFVSVHAIAASIFEYQDNPTRQEMEWMGEYVANVGRLIDAAWQAIQEGSQARIRARQERDRQMQAIESSMTKQSGRLWFFDTEKTFVYLMRHANGLTKIGRSKNPRLREKTLQAEDPRLSMIFHCEAEGYIETRLHQIFDSVRVRGEWFDLLPHHVEWVIFMLEIMKVKGNRYA